MSLIIESMAGAEKALAAAEAAMEKWWAKPVVERRHGAREFRQLRDAMLAARAEWDTRRRKSRRPEDAEDAAEAGAEPVVAEGAD